MSGDAAIDGTGTHLLLEYCLICDVSPEIYLGQTIGQGHADKQKGWEIKQDRVDRVNMVLNYIERRKKELKEQFPGCTVEVRPEQKLHPGDIYGRSDWYGTGDVILKAFDEQWRPVFVEVIDLKDGRMWVDAENNTQLQSYALGSVADHTVLGDPKDPFWDFAMRATIVQPKSSTPVRYDDFKFFDLLEVGRKLNEAAQRTDDENAPFTPDGTGKGHCRWCKHAINCEALQKSKQEKIVVGGMTLFKEGELTVRDLTNDRIAEILDQKDILLGILKEVETEAEERCEAGQNVPGYGMIPGRKTRSWNENEEEMVRALRARKLKPDQIWVKKLNTPAAILKCPDLTAKQKETLEAKYVSETVPMKFGRLKKQQPKPAKSLFDDVAPTFL